MRKFIIGISIIAIILSYLYALVHVLKDMVYVSVDNHVYHGTYSPSARGNAGLMVGLPDITPSMPQPTLKSVNVDLKQYHFKAAQYQNKLEIQNEIRSYSSGRGLTLSSNHVTRSFGGGMGSAMYSLRQNQRQAANYSAVFAYTTPSLASLPSYTTATNRYHGLSQWNNRINRFSYRALGGSDYNGWVLDYMAGTGSTGYTDNGNGTYTVTEEWIAGLYSYLTSVGINDPLLPEFKSWWGGQTTYILAGAEEPEDPDPVPIGSGIVILPLLAGVYIIRKRQNLITTKPSTLNTQFRKI